MKKLKYSVLSVFAAGLISMSSCKKDSQNIYDRFDDVNVSYNTALDGNEVILDFEIATPTALPAVNQMYTVYVAETGSSTPLVTLPVGSTERNKFAAFIKLKKSNSSPVTYRVWAVGSTGSEITAATVVFNGGNPVANPILVGENTIANEGETVYLDYTITSAQEDMYYVTVERYPGTGNQVVSRTVTNITDDSNRKSYSGLIKQKANRDGKTTYRIYAQNRQNVYIGDGYKTATIEVPGSSYIFLYNRKVYAPSSDNSSLSFYSILKDKAFSYSEGKVNSGDIDFGVWTKVDANNRLVYNMYSLSNPTNPNPAYDITDWQKRGTKFSAFIPASSTLFNNELSSGSELIARAMAANPSRTMNEGTVQSNGLNTNTLVYFVTPENKYGALFVNALTSDYDGRPYLSISIKLQK